MKLRDPRLVMVLRVAIVVSALTGIILTALGPPTILGLLPYFTIQSNLAVALFAAYATGRARRGDVEPSPVLQGAVTLYITITGLVYHLVLANPASPFAMAQPDRDWVSATGNQLLHTVVPLLAVIDWLLVDSRGRFRLRFAVYWLAFPLAYLGFALVRGLMVHRYPYPFIDAAKLGYDGVAVSTLFFAFAFWVLGLIFVLIDRGLQRVGGRRQPARTAGGRQDGGGSEQVRAE